MSAFWPFFFNRREWDTRDLAGWDAWTCTELSRHWRLFVLVSCATVISYHIVIAISNFLLSGISAHNTWITRMKWNGTRKGSRRGRNRTSILAPLNRFRENFRPTFALIIGLSLHGLLQNSFQIFFYFSAKFLLLFCWYSDWPILFVPDVQNRYYLHTIIN